MSGILKIHSNASEGGLFGHSWIEYCPMDGVPVTYGTWGNHPDDGPNGLRENLELGRQGEYCRATFINAQQAIKLFTTIASYRAAGADAWSLAHPCSAFAAETWEAVTGEHLVHRNAMLSTPARLARSIVKANFDSGFAQGRRGKINKSGKGFKPKSD